ncbi:MAG: hypothetical protein IPK63_01730 [Candidatus Competibacteraceae bacterium]|nr:hypothetical protein [Candidatus Competibacteraceae bacterium]
MRDFPSPCLAVRPSRWLLIGGGMLHLMAVIAVLLSSLAIWIKAGFIAGLGLSVVLMAFRNGLRRSRGFVSRIEWLDGRWRLESGDGAIHQAQLIAAYAHPAIVILNFRLEDGRRRSLTLLPDSTNAEVLRRLRVWLRVSRKAEWADTAP